MKGNRAYLSCCSSEHKDFPIQKGVSRLDIGLIANYFEPTVDGTSVKAILIVNVRNLTASTTASFTKDNSIQIHLESIKNLKTLLLGTRESAAKVTYLQKTADVAVTSPLLVSQDSFEDKK